MRSPGEESPIDLTAPDATIGEVGGTVEQTVADPATVVAAVVRGLGNAVGHTVECVLAGAGAQSCPPAG